jgi:secondary thiamine-phosphate synthase enzyme
MTNALKITTDTLKVSTHGHSDVVDISDKVTAVVEASGIAEGIVTVFVIGSTAALTTIEFEPGLVHDIKECLERVAPEKGHYQHHARWGDDNGHSHCRASLIGPTLVVPFVNRRMKLGTWQQIVLVDFDTCERQREVVVQVMGA